MPTQEQIHAAIDSLVEANATEEEIADAVRAIYIKETA
jgi:hypothetical protein